MEARRGDEHGGEEQRAGDEVRQPGAGALFDTGARLDEDRVRRRRRRTADDRAGALDDQRRLQSRKGALLVGEAGLPGQAGEGAHRVEEVGEDQGEHQHQRGEDADAAEAVQAEGADERQVGQRERRTGQLRHRQAPAAGALGGGPEVPDRLDDDGQQGARDEPDEDAAAHPPGHQHGGHQQGEDEDDASGRFRWSRCRRSPGPPAATAPRSSPMKPASTSPMKRMNNPMPAVIASFSSIGTASKISLRRPVAASSTMMSPLMTTSAHRLGPGELADDGGREERVDAEARGERERQPRDDAEQDRHDAGGQRRHGRHLVELEAGCRRRRRRPTG